MTEALKAQFRHRMEVADLVSDCAFLLAIIDNCSEAGGPCGELDPDDSSRVHDIRALISKHQGLS